MIYSVTLYHNFVGSSVERGSVGEARFSLQLAAIHVGMKCGSLVLDSKEYGNKCAVVECGSSQTALSQNVFFVMSGPLVADEDCLAFASCP